MNSNLLDLLRILWCIKFFAKDIHYSSKGENFYSDHLFADEVADGLDDLIDSVNENLYLGYQQEPPTSREVLEVVMDELPHVSDDSKQNWKMMFDLIDHGLQVIESIEADYDMPELNSLMDTIADNLQKSRGLIWRRIV